MLLNTSRNFLVSENENIEEAKVIVLGVPFDSTEITLPGQRLAPLEIRKALLSLELNELLDEVYDAGDVVVVHGSVKKTMERLEDVLNDIWKRNNRAVLLVLGGEHTVTYGVVKFLATKFNELQLVFMDAHGDAYDEYMGLKLCHATVLKRIDELGNVKIATVGIREELEELSNLKNLVSIDDLNREKPTYVSIDVDVLDPSLMPGVSDPVPIGLKVENVINYIKRFDFLVGVDVVELNPILENNISPRTAAWIMREIMMKVRM